MCSSLDILVQETIIKRFLAIFLGSRVISSQFDSTITLQKVNDNYDSKLGTFGRSINRQRAAPNCVALAALV